MGRLARFIHFYTDEDEGGKPTPTPEVWKTASGAIVSFATSVAYPMRKLLAQIEPQQEGSGDPSPENVRPITGWTGLSGKRDGKNLLDRSNPDRPNSLVATDGTISGNNNFDTWYFKHVGEFAISLTVTEANNNGRIVVMNADGTKDTTVTLPTTIGRGSATFSVADGQTAYISVRKSAEDCQIETGSTASTYEAYTGEAISVTWQDEAGTVYDGYIDVVSGELVATHGIVDLATLTWTATSWGGWRSSIVQDFKEFVTTVNANLIAEKYKSAPRAEMQSVPSSISGGLSTDPKRLFVNATDSPTGMCVYPLAEPVVYQLTPQQIETLLGNNTVFVDTGDVEVTYRES